MGEDEAIKLLRELFTFATPDSNGPYEDFTLEWQQSHYARIQAFLRTYDEGACRHAYPTGSSVCALCGEMLLVPCSSESVGEEKE